MSLRDILLIERERVKREKIVLSTVYDRMQNRINNSVRVRSKECIYTVPEMIPGYPLVNIDKTMNYLLKKLQKEGFIAFPINKSNLYVTWDPEKIRQLHKQQQINEIKKKNPIVNKETNEKEFERANDDIINFLVSSKKSQK